MKIREKKTLKPRLKAEKLHGFYAAATYDWGLMWTRRKKKKRTLTRVKRWKQKLITSVTTLFVKRQTIVSKTVLPSVLQFFFTYGRMQINSKQLTPLAFREIYRLILLLEAIPLHGAKIIQLSNHGAFAHCLAKEKFIGGNTFCCATIKNNVEPMQKDRHPAWK